MLTLQETRSIHAYMNIKTLNTFLTLYSTQAPLDAFEM